jgi:hypothetical protein
MTRKDFQAIARAFRDTATEPWSDSEELWSELLHKVADYLATTNPRFDRERFLRAATGEGK